jgi:hypothetical protein
LAAIHRQVRELERATAKAETDSAKSRNIAALCSLFVEIGQHPELPNSPAMQRLSIRLRTRLAGLERRTIKELRRRRLPEPESMIEERQAFQRSRAFRGSPYRRRQTAENTSMGQVAMEGSASLADEKAETRSANMPQAGVTAGNHAPGGLPDYGWLLVHLIRQTIQPEYWSVAGGPGKVIYYGPSRALVVYGSWRVQEDVAELLNALRGG